MDRSYDPKEMNDGKVLSSFGSVFKYSEKDLFMFEYFSNNASMRDGDVTAYMKGS